MIKIGIMAFLRKDQIDFTIEKIKENTVNDFEFLIACDSKELYDHCVRKGYPCIGGTERVGYAKNRNRLHEWFSAGGDDFFKFDDDCYPIKRGWDQWILDAHEETGYPYFLFAPSCKMYGNQIGTIVFTNYTATLWELDGSIMVSMKPAIIERLGGIHIGFGKYGGESSEFSQRVARLGLIPKRGISLEKMDEWLWTPHIDEYMKMGPRGALSEWDGKQEEADFALSMWPEISTTSNIYQPLITE